MNKMGVTKIQRDTRSSLQKVFKNGLWRQHLVSLLTNHPILQGYRCEIFVKISQKVKGVIYLEKSPKKLQSRSKGMINDH